MEQVQDSYAAVYRVVREANVCGYVTPGLRGQMYSALDNLKLYRASTDHISIAERISVILHGLEWATQRKDAKRLKADWQSLGALEEQWLSFSAPRA